MRLATIVAISMLIAACGSSRSAPADGDGGAAADAGSGDGDGGTTCAAGERYYYPGCGSGEDVTITAGCYQPCTGADDFTTCAAPLVCQRTDINPCVCPPEAEGCCAACGAEQWLCLPWEAGDTEPYDLDSLDEVCEELLSGQDLLDAMHASYAATLTYTADSSTTTLDLSFAYAGGRLICHPAIPAPPGSGAPDQPAYLEVEVDVTVATADGWFDEAGTTLLSSGARGAPVSFNATFAVPDLVGSYVPQRADLTDHAVWFAGTASLDSASGMAMEGGMRSGGVGEVLPIGRWSWP